MCCSGWPLDSDFSSIGMNSLQDIYVSEMQVRCPIEKNVVVVLFDLDDEIVDILPVKASREMQG